MRRFAVVVSAAITLMIGGCQSTGSGQTVGTLVGAGVGGLVGSQIGSGAGNVVATIAGVAIGGLIGNQIGALLDEREQARMQDQTKVVLSSPQPAPVQEWRDPQRNRTYRVRATTPTQRTRTPQGTQQECRSFVQEVVDEKGETHSESRRACRTASGDWQVVT